MFKHLYPKVALLTKKSKAAFFLTGFISVGLWAILISYKNGPANHGQAVSGAPFNNGIYCTKCHSGGNFGAAIKLQLLDSANKVVKKYTPNKKYTFKITLTKTSTNITKYGFQTTVATAASNANINKWGKLPVNTHNKLLSGHNYVEHSTPLASGIIKIPWTAPAAGTGSVIFYTAGNVVNGNNHPTGDQPVKTQQTITEALAPAPAIFASYKAELKNNYALVSWSTSKEEGANLFIIEKSISGTDFNQAGTLRAKGRGNYSFVDNQFNGKAYYRLKIEDINGNMSYNYPLTVAKPDKNNYRLSLYNHGGAAYINFTNNAKQQRVQVIYTDFQGRPLSSGITIANEGDNVWLIPRNKIKGPAIVTVVGEDGIKTSLKFSISQ